MDIRTLQKEAFRTSQANGFTHYENPEDIPKLDARGKALVVAAILQRHLDNLYIEIRRGEESDLTLYFQRYLQSQSSTWHGHRPYICSESISYDPDIEREEQQQLIHAGLIGSEVSELINGMLSGDPLNVAEELADIMIRCGDWAKRNEIDLQAAVVAKMKKNRKRGERHGSKAVA